MVLVLKRLGRWGHSLKSHPTDCEKPRNDPATPGLQDIVLSPYIFFCGFPGYNVPFRENIGQLTKANFYLYLTEIHDYNGKPQHKNNSLKRN